MSLFQGVLNMEGQVFWGFCNQYFFGSRVHLSRAPWFVLIFEHQKDFPDFQPDSVGLSVTQWRFCFPPASWRWLFFHSTIRVLAPLQTIASVKRLAVTAKGGSRISHFSHSEQFESYYGRRTCPGLREAWGSLGSSRMGQSMCSEVSFLLQGLWWLNEIMHSEHLVQGWHEVNAQ